MKSRSISVFEEYVQSDKTGSKRSSKGSKKETRIEKIQIYYEITTLAISKYLKYMLKK